MALQARQREWTLAKVDCNHACKPYNCFAKRPLVPKWPRTWILRATWYGKFSSPILFENPMYKQKSHKSTFLTRRCICPKKHNKLQMGLVLSNLKHFTNFTLSKGLDDNFGKPTVISNWVLWQVLMFRRHNEQGGVWSFMCFNFAIILLHFTLFFSVSTS